MWNKWRISTRIQINYILEYKIKGLLGSTEEFIIYLILNNE